MKPRDIKELDETENEYLKTGVEFDERRICLEKTGKGRLYNLLRRKKNELEGF